MPTLICAVFSIILLVNSYVAQAESLDSLLQQVQEKIALGYYYQAQNELQQLAADTTQSYYNNTAIRGLQGYLALQQHHYNQANTLLNSALAQANKNSWHDLIAHFALYLGQLNEQQQQHTAAEHYFKLALTQADHINDKSLTVSSLCSLAKLALADSKIEMAGQLVQQASLLLKRLPINAANNQLGLTIGYLALELHQQHTTENDYLRTAFDSLYTVQRQAKQLSQNRTEATALQYLALLYSEQQPQEAIKLLLTGISLAQKEEANDILLNLEWQLGKLYKSEQQAMPAIAAYKRALKHLEAIRLDIPVSYKQGQSSFKMTFAPLYLGLADLLLQQAPLAVPEQRQVLLQEAQNTIELMKKSELEDYFQNRCDMAAEPINLQKKDAHAAVLYPIVLPNRLELIIYTKTGLQQVTQSVTAKELEQQARTFSNRVRSPFGNTKKLVTQAELLYQWLIKPIESLLEQQQIDTLVYIPDGFLRLVPLGALYHNNKFLIEDYAVAILPGISLIETNNVQHKTKDMLLVGMSVPGEVVTDLPNSLLTDLIDVPETNTSTGEKSRALRELLKDRSVVGSLKKELALPGVEIEIKQLAEQNSMPYFLNEQFSLANFTQLALSKPHNILHIASHGFFGSSAEESFIMTHDKILTMNQLESLLNVEFFKKNPIDLLTLSACQTAEGDDRSPLGISGIAIKAKVHSALGSLWPVSDEATSQLMTTFYKELRNTGLGKAKALQKAEISLLKQEKFRSPSFWSPFILVGDWL